MSCAADGIDEADLLALAAGLEKGSEHPLAEAIVEGATERGVAIADGRTTSRRSPARASPARVAGRSVALGNQAMMDDLGVDTGPLAERADALRAEGKTAMFVAVDGKPRRHRCGRRSDQVDDGGRDPRAARAAA